MSGVDDAGNISPMLARRDYSIRRPSISGCLMKLAHAGPFLEKAIKYLTSYQRSQLDATGHQTMVLS
jgi:hypothetical protein